jgi:hypothetical protein
LRPCGKVQEFANSQRGSSYDTTRTVKDTPLKRARYFDALYLLGRGEEDLAIAVNILVANSSFTFKGAQVVTVLGGFSANIDIELTVKGEMVPIAVWMYRVLANPLLVLFVGKGLEGVDSTVKFAGDATSLELALAILAICGYEAGADDVEANAVGETLVQGLLKGVSEAVLYIVAGCGVGYC